MKLEIYKKKKTKPEQINYLKLVRKSDSIIHLVVVDSEGNEVAQGELLMIDKRVFFLNSIDPELGFDLDEKGGLIIG